MPHIWYDSLDPFVWRHNGMGINSCCCDPAGICRRFRELLPYNQIHPVPVRIRAGRPCRQYHSPRVML